MTDEYIKKEDALKEKRTGIFPNGICMEGKACVTVEYIKSIPPADVAPVVHGEYIGEYDGYADGNPVCDMWYCSVCGCCFEDWDEKPTYNFCPSCGAKMDAQGEE